jgi:hypothetical protein
MAVIRSAPLKADLSGFAVSEGSGSQYSGTPPQQIPNSVWIDKAPDGSTAMHAKVLQSDPLTAGGQRAEVSMVADAFNTPLWYAWEMYVPSSWPKTGKPYTVMQIHDTPDASDSVIVWPNIEMMIKDSSLLVKVANDFTNKGVSASRDLLAVPMQFDEWVQCAVFADWRKADSAGFLEIYFNRQLVDRRYGIQSSYSDVVGSYMKLGVYDCMHYGDFGTLDAYYRNVVVRDGSDGAIAAMGGTPIAANRRFAVLPQTRI